MASRIQLTLATLLVGFLIVGPLEALTYVNRFQQIPYASSIFIVSPIITLIGLLILYIGRFEWDGILKKRFRHAHLAFCLDILSLGLAVLPLLAIAVVFLGGSGTDLSVPSWLHWEFGAAIMASLLFSFATYVLVAFSLTSNHGKALLLVAFCWAGGISIWIGYALSHQLGTIITALESGSMQFGPVSGAISQIEPYFAVSYVLLAIVYVDAYHRLHTHTPSAAPVTDAQPTTSPAPEATEE